MSTTETETLPQPAPEQAHAPEITILTRVASIPMISSGIDTINGALSTNTYTRAPYATAKDLSVSAYKLTEPLQVKLAPLIVRADGYANKAVDAVESRYPYPFKAQPEEVVNYALERKETATNYVHEQVNTVNKAIEEKIKTPALHVAQDIDQRFAPIVNYIEGAVSRFNQSEAGPSTPPDAQYQYQRALALSKTFRDNLTIYTSEQINHIQEQSVLVQKASETAHTISSTASSSIHSAQTRILSLSDSMLTELQKVQDSTKTFAASLQSTLLEQKSTLQSQVPHIQQQFQQSYTDLSAALSSTVSDLAAIIKDKELPVQDKVTRVGKEVNERVQPILENVKKSISEILARSKSAAPAAETSEESTSEKNGEADPAAPSTTEATSETSESK